MTGDPRSSPPSGTDELSPLERYKLILRQILETRPSGTRQRLAEALGKNRSFISQIVNPAYATPIPVQHLETIFHICHVTPTERAAFLSAYREAHPGRLEVVAAPRTTRIIQVVMPDFGDPVRNARADALVRALVQGIAGLLPPDGEDNENGEPAP